jgi:uncharacterized membrane protein YagU involved in acid resistance
MSSRSSGEGHVVRNVIAGFVGGLVASFAMEQFQNALGRLSEDIGGAPGGGGQQHRKPQTEPATYQAANAISTATTGHRLSRDEKPVGGALVHYAFGGAVGAMYGAAASQNSEITAWGGLPFGATVWLIADEVGVPLAGLSKAPTEYPVEDHLSAFATHLVYGATTEAVRKLLTLGSRNQ